MLESGEVNIFVFWTCAVILVALFWQWWKKPHHRFPPGRRGLPFLGVVPYFGHHPERVMHKWSRETYGPIMSVRIGNSDSVVLNTYDALQKILLQQSDKVASRSYLHVYNQVSKDYGFAFTKFHAVYKKKRQLSMKMLRKGFGLGQIAVTSAVNEEIEHLLPHLKSICSEPVDMKDIMARLALNITGKVVCSTLLEYNEPKMVATVQMYSKLFSETEDAFYLVQLLLFPKLRFLPFYHGANERAKTCIKRLIDEFVDPIVQEHKANFDPGNIRDLVDAYLLEWNFKPGNNNNNEFEDAHLQFMVHELFGGGLETTSSAMAWFILYYLHHPEYHETLQEEVDRILDEVEMPSLSLRDKMPFTFAFMQEILRFSPPINLNYRETVSPVTYQDYVIPVNTRILINQWGIQRDPKIWTDPDKFDPSRHIDDQGNFTPSNKLVCFGAGYRSCVGESIARIELFCVFTRLLKNFVIRPDSQYLPPLDTGHNNLAHSPYPFKVVLTPRS